MDAVSTCILSLIKNIVVMHYIFVCLNTLVFCAVADIVELLVLADVVLSCISLNRFAASIVLQQQNCFLQTCVCNTSYIYF